MDAGKALVQFLYANRPPQEVAHSDDGIPGGVLVEFDAMYLEGRARRRHEGRAEIVEAMVYAGTGDQLDPRAAAGLAGRAQFTAAGRHAAGRGPASGCRSSGWPTTRHAACARPSPRPSPGRPTAASGGAGGRPGWSEISRN